MAVLGDFWQFLVQIPGSSGLNILLITQKRHRNHPEITPFTMHLGSIKPRFCIEGVLVRPRRAVGCQSCVKRASIECQQFVTERGCLPDIPETPEVLEVPEVLESPRSPGSPGKSRKSWKVRNATLILNDFGCKGTKKNDIPEFLRSEMSLIFCFLLFQVNIIDRSYVHSLSQRQLRRETRGVS